MAGEESSSVGAHAKRLRAPSPAPAGDAPACGHYWEERVVLDLPRSTGRTTVRSMHLSCRVVKEQALTKRLLQGQDAQFMINMYVFGECVKQFSGERLMPALRMLLPLLLLVAFTIGIVRRGTYMPWIFGLWFRQRRRR